MKSKSFLLKIFFFTIASVINAGCGEMSPTSSSSMQAAASALPRNAQIVGDFFYLRDANGNTIPGRRVDDGDHILVLGIDYEKQLVLVEYPTPSGVNVGYIKNVQKLIKYYHQDRWQNDGFPKDVYDSEGKVIGMLYPYEKATPLNKMPDGSFLVVYNTSKGELTKTGYVSYHGNFPQFRDTPSSCILPKPEEKAKSCENEPDNSILNRSLCLTRCGGPAVVKSALKCSFMIPALPEALIPFGICTAGWLGTTDAGNLANCIAKCW